MIDEKKLIEELKCLVEQIDESIEHTILGESYKKKRQAEAEFCRAIIDFINAQPKLDVPDICVGKWIPCSERLPEKSGRYIVTSMDYVNAFEAIFFKSKEDWVYIDACGEVKNVIALMEKPEPYKGNDYA